jgi:polyhydroxybutyrate depolymerase
MQYWLKKNNCGQGFETIQLPNACKKDKSTVTIIRYTGCDKKTQILLFQINNGGHTWPGAQRNLFFLGKLNKDIHASKVIWEFFKEHMRE